MSLSKQEVRKALLYTGGTLVAGGLVLGLTLAASRLTSKGPSGLPVRLVHTINPSLTSVASEKVRALATQGIRVRLAGRPA